MKYEFLEHTADVKFKAYGKDLEEAFTNCAYALADTITDHEKVNGRIEKEIEVEAHNEEALLYDFLEQFLVLLDSENFLLHEVKSISIKKNKNYEVTARIAGDNKPKEYEIETHIKAVTYQEMFIKKEKDRYVIQVILDI